MKQTIQDRIVVEMNKYKTEANTLQDQYIAGEVDFDRMLGVLSAIQEKYADRIGRIAKASR